MKTFFIGSYKTNVPHFEKFSSFCKDLGNQMTIINTHHMVLCSPFPDSVDYHIIQGIKSAKKINTAIDLHYPQDSKIEMEWDNLITPIIEKKINKFRYPPIEKKAQKDWKYSWLLCQIQALNDSDLIISIGGDVDGSSSLLLRIAETRNKMIIPIRQFGGSGDLFFERNRYELKDKLGNDHFSILENPINNVDGVINLIKEYPNQQLSEKQLNKEPTFFISYPRARPAEADFIEMILRRRNFTVLRDEKEFKADEDIPNAIKENIYKSDIFISVWCREYACSPWCFDELTLALERKKKSNMEIWLLCVDETRVVHPEARRMLNHPVNSRSEIEGKILNLLDKMK